MTLSESLQALPRSTEEERQELREVLEGYDPARERPWTQLAKQRLRDIKAGERTTVAGDGVLAEGRWLAQKQSSERVMKAHKKGGHERKKWRRHGNS